MPKLSGLHRISLSVSDLDASVVPDHTELERWRDRLDTLGITRSEIAAGSSGDLIAFRDPDNIALEFYTLVRAT